MTTFGLIINDVVNVNVDVVVVATVAAGSNVQSAAVNRMQSVQCAARYY